MQMQLKTPIAQPQAWKNADHAHNENWIYHLPDSALSDIDRALEALHNKQIAFENFTKSDFPLPSIEKDLREILEHIEQGRGFVVVRGLPVERYNVDEIVKVFWGIGAYLGRAISQNAGGDLVTHVTDRGLEYGAQNVRGYMTRGGQKFHTDNCDIVGLLCYRKAKTGGLSGIASSMAIYNEFLEHYPQYLDQLYQGFFYDLRGEERPNMPPITQNRIPVFSYYDGRLSCRYVYMSIIQAARKKGVPLSEHEIATLDTFNEIASRADIRLDMDLQPGDMQFISNHTVVHGRTEYVDHEEQELKRHMVRLWLVPEEPRPLEPRFADRYGTGERLGVPPVAQEVHA